MVQATMDAMSDFGLGIVGECMDETPVLTGDLRRDLPFSSDKEAQLIESVIQFQIRSILEYSVYVHENLEARHIIGKSKFIEDPMNRNAPRFPEFLAERIWETIQEEEA